MNRQTPYIYYRLLLKSIFTFYLKFKNNFVKNYIVENIGGNKWIFVSYIVEPFKRKKDDAYFHGHQNRQETLIISAVAQELRFSYVFNDYDKPLNFYKRKFDIIFGLEPHFKIMCDKNPKAIKIYYATGAYYKHQNLMIINRTNAFCEKYNTNYPYKRLVKEHNSCDIADYIFQIGSKFTIETYPINLRHKIILINQTSHVFKNINIVEKIKVTSKSDFIWFGSGGTILKGLDLVLEYFIANKNLNLNVVGPIEYEFLKVFKNQIKTASNIKFYGYLDVESNEFRYLANICAFLIFPSASEGCPGSVINLQKLGVIPILSRWASSNNIEEHGYQLKELNMTSIIEAINWSQALTYECIINLIKSNCDYISETHSNERFKMELLNNFNMSISL